MTAVTASHQILLDVVQCLLWALPLGLLAHHWFGERVISLAGWDGRPRPGLPSDYTDLVVAVGLIFLLRWQVVQAGVMGERVTGRDLGVEDVLASVFGQVVMWMGLLFYLRGLRRRGLTAWLGLPDARRLAVLAPLAVVWTVLAGVVVYGAAWLMNTKVWPSLGFEPAAQDIVRELAENPNLMVRGMIILAACVVAPVVEETLFRGFLYPALRQGTDAPFATIFTAVLFGAVHGTLAGLVPLALLGVMLVLAYEWSRGLALPVAIHALFNVLSSASLWTNGLPVEP